MGEYHYVTGPGPHTVVGALTAAGTGAAIGAVTGAAGGAAGYGLTTAGSAIATKLFGDSSFTTGLQPGEVVYGPLDSLGRPTGIQAHLTPDMVGTGTPPLRSITPPGFMGGAAGQARGHLLGAQLGGSGAEERNLITIYQNPANSPAMRGFENQVRAALDAGQNVHYAATPVYDGAAPVAQGITLQAHGSGGLSFHVSIINRGI